MFGWTLLDAILGGDAEVLIGATDSDLTAEGGEGEDLETEAGPPDPIA
jgi:hypothetical protein